MPNSFSNGLSPHIVVIFSILLRLEGYAELLVTFDRQRAKRLLRLAMGVSTSEHRSFFFFTFSLFLNEIE